MWLARFLSRFMSSQKNGEMSKSSQLPPQSNIITLPTKKPALSDLFTLIELRCKGKNCGCGNAVILDPLFERELLKLRLRLNLPMQVNSCCRCKVHNARVAGKPKSFHISDKPAWDKLKGCGAIDIGYTNLTYRNALARVAYELGWRIGLHKTFLHLDIAHLAGYPESPELPKFFKYQGIVTDAELAEFKRQISGVKTSG